MIEHPIPSLTKNKDELSLVYTKTTAITDER
jgi:hypothetical protein